MNVFIFVFGKKIPPDDVFDLKWIPDPERKQMANQLNVGDVVQLNSGGPDMTVAIVRPNAKEAVCTWIGEGGTTPCAEFKSACLTLVRAAPEQPRAAPVQTPLEKAAEEYRLATEKTRALREESKALHDRASEISEKADAAWVVQSECDSRLHALIGIHRETVVQRPPGEQATTV